MKLSENKLVLYIRATIFWAGFLVSTLIYAPLAVLTFPLPVLKRYQFIITWSHFNIWWLKMTCGVRFVVKGRQNLPQGTAVFLAKHQSTWETLALQQILPPHVWVLKKELFKIPFFGWGLAMLQPIAIDRKAGRKAVEQMLTQGKQKLDHGWSVMIFPEGTRVKPGNAIRYKLGGAILASQVEQPVIPIAHNAGEFWPRHSYIKWPGTITVIIGEPIQASGREPDAINEEVKNWIENRMKEISDQSRWNR